MTHLATLGEAEKQQWLPTACTSLHLCSACHYLLSTTTRWVQHTQLNSHYLNPVQYPLHPSTFFSLFPRCPLTSPFLIHHQPLHSFRLASLTPPLSPLSMLNTCAPTTPCIFTNISFLFSILHPLHCFPPTTYPPLPLPFASLPSTHHLFPSPQPPPGTGKASFAQNMLNSQASQPSQDSAQHASQPLTQNPLAMTQPSQPLSQSELSQVR